MRIGLHEASKHFGDRNVLGPVSVEFGDTGLTVIGGPNGAGKSVFLRLLAGILKPSTGELLWNGSPVHTHLNAYKFRIGYMPQSPAFYEDQTVETALRYFARLKAIPANLVASRVDELLRILHLGELAKTRVKHLSGGERSRLAFAVALLNDPDVLLLDEPGGNLDPSERRQFWDLIGQMTSGRSVVMATHVFAGLEGLVDRMIVLDEGQLLHDAPVDRLLREVSGQVWEIQTPADQEIMVPSKEVQVVWKRQDGHSMLWHVLAQERPADGARQAPATLDDVYLWMRWRSKVNN